MFKNYLALMALSQAAAWDPDWQDGNDSSSKLTKYCHKYVNIFGMTLCVTKRSWKASEDKAKHVANVIAQFLDNDEDGVADDPNLPAQLASNNALLFYYEKENDMIWDS
jgi:hypothetical protein